MAKKIVAVTGIRHTNGFCAAGDTVDPSEFTKEELKSLYDNGAIAVVDDTTPEEIKDEGGPAKEVTPEPETPKGPDTSVKDPTAPKDPTAKK